MPISLRFSLLLPLFLASPIVAFSQQDCINAISVCNSSYAQNTSFSGIGNVQDVAPATTCLGNGEVNSVWYRFTVYTSGNLSLQLNPQNLNDDYDFALYNLSNDSCSGIQNGSLPPISCNYSSSPGPTGLSSSGIGNNNGSSDPNQNAVISVVAGESYALLVSNFTASQNGYTLDFGGSASVADNSYALPDSISFKNICNPQNLFLFFDEMFDCSTISGTSEITITGPETTIISSVSAVGCNSGFTNQIRIRLNGKIQTTGTYTISINPGTDGDTYVDGCGNQVPPGTEYTFTVDYIGPDLSIINVVNTSCGINQGSAEVVATMGTTPYTYLWNSSPPQNTAVASNLEAGTYRIRVTDANGCRDQRNVEIENDSPLDITTVITGVSCNGASDGAAELIPNGGVVPYTVTWSSSPQQVGFNATGLQGGPITATLVDFTGCLEEFELFIPEPPELLINIDPVLPDCGFNNGSLTASATGGNGNFGYSWNVNPVQTTPTLSNIEAGVYGLTVTDQSGCSATTTHALVNANAPDVDVVDRIPDCGQNTGQATVSPTLIGPTYSFEWNTNPPQTTATATNLAAGEYFVNISDLNGCVQIRNVKIDAIAPPTLSLTLTEPTCGAADGEALATLSNGIMPFTYTWSSSSNVTNTEIALMAGTYTVSAVDSIGCTATESFTLNELPPESDFAFVDVCNGDEMSFVAQSNSNATAWFWDFGDGNSSTLETPVHTYSTFGQFDVTVYFSGGCLNDTVTQTVSVFEPPTAAFTITPETITTRTNASFLYAGIGGTQFNWDFGDGEISTENNPMHQYSLEGFYTIQLTTSDQNGCQDTTSQTIEVLLQPVIYFPNAFLPNGTGENSTFKGYGLGITSAELSIYNRWGTQVYFSANSREILQNGWDGRYKGKMVANGVYAYKVNASFYDGASFEKLGTITLIR